MRQIDQSASFAPLWSTLATRSATPVRPVAHAPRGGDLYGSAGVGVRRGLETLRLWRQRARGRKQLRTFDDHLLRDIGITRLQAEAEADKPFWRA
jgi:uncharacterized protein YjiS (DUF1127 family)